MLNVFITIDTEIWQQDKTPGNKPDFNRDMATYIYGSTSKGEFGVPLQMRILNEHGLKATFFVESLFASAMGLAPLREIVELIKSGGHDIQLHLHPEWLDRLVDRPSPNQLKHYLHQFDATEQAALISKAACNLQSCGVDDLSAFRAGNYGASAEMLCLLDQIGIRYDTSYNPCFLDTACKLSSGSVMLQPRQIDGVYEFPVSIFSDYPRHYRHAQICACSFNELKYALISAWQKHWYSFIIVFHSFELLNIPRNGRSPYPDMAVINRFEKLCAFLAGSRDKFNVNTFSGIEKKSVLTNLDPSPIRSNIFLTAMRFVEQIIRRLD